MSTRNRTLADDRTASPRLAQRDSVVYFARRARDGAIKVGVTTDLRARMYRLHSTEHDDIEVLATRLGGRYLEAQIHRALKDDRLDGEWFKPTQRVHDAAAGRIVADEPDPFAELPSPRRGSGRTSQEHRRMGARDNLRCQIAGCWAEGMSGRQTAVLLEITTAKLTREVKLMSEQGYF